MARGSIPVTSCVANFAGASAPISFSVALGSPSVPSVSKPTRTSAAPRMSACPFTQLFSVFLVVFQLITIASDSKYRLDQRLMREPLPLLSRLALSGVTVSNQLGGLVLSQDVGMRRAYCRSCC